MLGHSTPSAGESQIGQSERIMDKEKNSDGNAERRSAWNRPSNGDSGTKPVMGAFSWPPLSETTNAPSSAHGSSSVPHAQPRDYLAEIVFLQQTLTLESDASASTKEIVSQLVGQSSSGNPEHPLPHPFPTPQNHRNHFASQSQNHHQHNPNKNQGGSRQSHGGKRPQEYGNQNWNFNRNFNGRAGVVQPPFVRHAQPPPMAPLHAHYMPVHSDVYPLSFSTPMVFHGELSQPFLHYRPPVYHHQIQDTSHLEFSKIQDPSNLETKIRNQVHYYFSNDNLSKDTFLRKRMNDEGFVHVQFIASFKKLQELTDNINLILDSLQGSDDVEVEGYQIRKRHMWQWFLMPPYLRVPFFPNEDE